MDRPRISGSVTSRTQWQTTSTLLVPITAQRGGLIFGKTWGRLPHTRVCTLLVLITVRALTPFALELGVQAGGTSLI